MAIHEGETRQDGFVFACYLLDAELERLIEGICPFSGPDQIPHTPDEARLRVKGEWAVCGQGCAYRYPKRTAPWLTAEPFLDTSHKPDRLS